MVILQIGIVCFTHKLISISQPVPPESANGNVRRYVILVKAVGPYRFSDVKNSSTDTSLNFTVRGLFPWTKYNVSVQALTIEPGPISPWKEVQTLEAGK